MGGGLPPASSLSTVPLLTPALTAGASGSLPALTPGTTSPITSLPDLSSLLATPLPLLLGQTPTEKSDPLILSSALPPISGKMVERVQGGKFVEFKEFLKDNVLLLQKLRELGLSGAVAPSLQPIVSGSRLREVPDSAAWASCFLAFMATKVDHRETRELAAYGMIVLAFANQHTGPGWQAYDRQFRQHQAAGANLPWAEINPSLMSATVLSQSGGPGRSCPLCLAYDHTKEDCALFPLERASKWGEPSQGFKARQPRRPGPYGVITSAAVCYRYNRGSCQAAHCRFEHFCSNCGKPGHPAISCPDPRQGQGDPKSPPPPPRSTPGRAR